MLFSMVAIVEAFVQKIKSTQQQRTQHVNNIILHATKYVVIGGNIDGINNEEEDTYNMSKKERRRREREKCAADFKSGKHKLKKKGTKINYDKLEDKVTRERTFPEQAELRVAPPEAGALCWRWEREWEEE